MSNLTANAPLTSLHTMSECLLWLAFAFILRNGPHALRYDYADLLLNSKFGLVLPGVGEHSYRLLEVLQVVNICSLSPSLYLSLSLLLSLSLSYTHEQTHTCRLVALAVSNFLLFLPTRLIPGWRDSCDHQRRWHTTVGWNGWLEFVLDSHSWTATGSGGAVFAFVRQQCCCCYAGPCCPRIRNILLVHSNIHQLGVLPTQIANLVLPPSVMVFTNLFVPF